MLAADFTKIQRAILEALADGKPHWRNDLYAICETPNNLRTHMSLMRKKLRPGGQDIVCVLRNRRIHYQWIRLLASACDGRK